MTHEYGVSRFVFCKSRLFITVVVSELVCGMLVVAVDDMLARKQIKVADMVSVVNGSCNSTKIVQFTFDNRGGASSISKSLVVVTRTQFGVLRQIEKVITFPYSKTGPNTSHERRIEFLSVFSMLRFVISDPRDIHNKSIQITIDCSEYYVLW